MRVASKDRAEFYYRLREMGSINANQIARREGLPPLDRRETFYYVPVNWQPMGEMPAAPANPAKGGGSSPPRNEIPLSCIAAHQLRGDRRSGRPAPRRSSATRPSPPRRSLPSSLPGSIVSFSSTRPSSPRRSNQRSRHGSRPPDALCGVLPRLTAAQAHIAFSAPPALARPKSPPPSSPRPWPRLSQPGRPRRGPGRLDHPPDGRPP